MQNKSTELFSPATSSMQLIFYTILLGTFFIWSHWEAHSFTSGFGSLALIYWDGKSEEETSKGQTAGGKISNKAHEYSENSFYLQQSRVSVWSRKVVFLTFGGVWVACFAFNIALLRVI